MPERLSRFGVGPGIVAAPVAYAVFAGIATHRWPDLFRAPWLGHPAFVLVAVVLIVLGLPMWLTGLVSAMRAYHRDRLATSGIFALVRHPMYAAWIVLLLPGLALLSRSWLILLVPLVTYAVFKALIGTEDDYLAKRFGQDYSNYRTRVREVIPIPRF